MVNKLKLKYTYAQIITLGFLSIILIGGLLLSLPISSRYGEWTPFIDALFTATSATCVTGLVVYDTYTHWSIFGQLIIITLIQIGGIGFMTIITLFSMFLKRQIGLHERKLLMHSAGTLKIGGVIRLIKRVAIVTIIFEGLGTIILTIRFYTDMGFLKALYNAFFHSVSAFCNAGFDIMGRVQQFSSLTNYSSDIIVNITIMFLIIAGGIGFIVWNDIVICRLQIKKYQLHTKIVLSATGLLIVVSACLFYLFERTSSFAGMNNKEMFLASLFQSITPRTAGFNTIDISSLSESGNLLTLILMFIGGSPGSTAGGIKVTTFVVLLMGAVASSRHTQHIKIFKRRMDENVVKQASAISTIYISVIIVSTLLICFIQPYSAKDVLFEVMSAAGTVGLSTGITPTLNIISKFIIMFLMFGGRVGLLTFALVLGEKRIYIPLDRPVERILIG